MNAHGIFRAGAALALLSAYAGAQEQQSENGFFAGLKLKTAAQAASRQDNLMPTYLGFGFECGYQLDFGRLSAEVGFMYKGGRQYLTDLTKMENASEATTTEAWGDPWMCDINLNKSVDSRKNQLDGLTLRLAYERPFKSFLVRGGLQLANFKFRQEYIGDVRDEDGYFRDAYNGVTDKGGLSISPFLGLSLPILTNHFVELNVVGLNYKSVNYVHVAGSVVYYSIVNGVISDGNGPQNSQTKLDRIEESSRFIPHIELVFGFRF